MPLKAYVPETYSLRRTTAILHRLTPARSRSKSMRFALGRVVGLLTLFTMLLTAPNLARSRAGCEGQLDTAPHVYLGGWSRGHWMTRALPVGVGPTG